MNQLIALANLMATLDAKRPLPGESRSVLVELAREALRAVAVSKWRARLAANCFLIGLVKWLSTMEPGDIIASETLERMIVRARECGLCAERQPGGLCA